MRTLLRSAALLALLVGSVDLGAQCRLLLLGAGTCGTAGGGGGSLTTDLVAYWEMNEASGSAVDAHGANTLTENNTMLSVAGVSGTTGDARKVGGSLPWFSINDNADVSAGNFDFTIAGWLRVDAVSASLGYIFAKDNSGGDREYGSYWSIDGVIHWFVFDPSSNFLEITSPAINDDQWYFIAHGYDAALDEIFLTIDAGTPITGSQSAGVKNGTDQFTIGARGNGGSSPLGDTTFDEVGFWKKRLSAGELMWLYNAGAGRSYADVVACSGC